MARVVAKNGILHIDATINGKRYRFSSGLKESAENYKYLRENLLNIVQCHNLGKNARELTKENPKEKSVKQTSFIELLNQVKLESFLNAKESTKLSLKYQYNELKRCFGMFDITQIKRENIANYYEYLVKKGCKNSSFKAKRSILGRVFKLAQQMQLITYNPLFAFKLKEQKSTQNTPFSFDEIKMILHHTKESAPRSFYNYLVIAFFTGARVKEILALKKENVDFKRDKLEIKGTVTTVQGRTFIQEPKTENSKRKIDILPPVRKALKEQFYFKKGAFFFIDSLEKADTTYKKFSQLWHKVLLELGFAKRVLYATRHSFATLMIDKGESILWISKMLGHKNAAITLNFYAKNERTDKEKHAQFLTQREF